MSTDNIYVNTNDMNRSCNLYYARCTKDLKSIIAIKQNVYDENIHKPYSFSD